MVLQFWRYRGAIVAQWAPSWCSRGAILAQPWCIVGAIVANRGALGAILVQSWRHRDAVAAQPWCIVGAIVVRKWKIVAQSWCNRGVVQSCQKDSHSIPWSQRAREPAEGLFFVEDNGSKDLKEPVEKESNCKWPARRSRVAELQVGLHG